MPGTRELRLALAVADPDMVRPAILLGTDNKPELTADGKPRRVTAQDAVARGGAYFVALRDGVIALDCDPDETPVDAWRRPAIEAARSSGCAAVRVGSGGENGNEHIFIVAPVGWTTTHIKDVLHEVVPNNVVRWGDRGVRPPLSPHRSGGVGSFIEPVDPDLALRLLEQRPGCVPLAPKWQQSLDGPAPAVRNGELFRAALAYVNAGMTLGRFKLAVSRSAWASAKATAEGGNYLPRMWEAASERVRHTPAGSNLNKHLADLELVHRSWPWTGQAGQTDCRVYRYLLNLARQLHTVRVSKDQRSIAEAVGCNRRTVSASLKRLESAKLIHLEAKSDLGQAATYRLAPEVAGLVTNSFLSTPREPIGQFSSNFSSQTPPDAFRARGGLTPSVYLTYRALPSDGAPVTVAGILDVRCSRISAATVRAHLRELSVAGLVERDRPRGHSWRVVPGADLDDVAEHRGTAGAAERQRKSHELQRAQADEAYAHRSGGLGRRVPAA